MNIIVGRDFVDCTDPQTRGDYGSGILKILYTYTPEFFVFTPNINILTQIGVTLEELLNVRSRLHSIDQLHQSRVWLQPFSSILDHILIVAQLEKDQIRICELLANGEWPPPGEIRTIQVSFNGFEKSVSVAPLMLWIVLLVVREERRNKEGPPFSKHQPSFLFQQDEALTINDNIAHGISPVFLVFSPSLPLICVQHSTPVPQNGITLSENHSVRHLNNWDVASWVHFRSLAIALVLWPFVEGVADVLVCCTGILERRSVDDLEWQI
jgi:hypothetical protein